MARKQSGQGAHLQEVGVVPGARPRKLSQPDGVVQIDHHAVVVVLDIVCCPPCVSHLHETRP